MPVKRILNCGGFQHYLSKTHPFSKNTQLFLATVCPHKPASRDTISRWVREMFVRAGIDRGFKPHSTRAAAVSATRRGQCSDQEILDRAGLASMYISTALGQTLHEEERVGAAVLDMGLCIIQLLHSSFLDKCNELEYIYNLVPVCIYFPLA